VSALALLTTYERLLLAYSCEIVHFSSDETIIQSGELVDHFYIIISGIVTLFLFLSTCWCLDIYFITGDNNQGQGGERFIFL
jgi:hypothetical protein